VRQIEIPTLRADGYAIAVAIETAEVAATAMTVVTIRERVSSPPYRRWYPEPDQALAYAVEQADRHGLPLLDLRDPGAEA
jgi:hypothetical protein